MRNKIFEKLKNECKLEDEVQIQEYIMNRKKQIIQTHIDNVFPIKEPNEKGGHPKYFLTKLTPKNKNKDGKIYASTREELEERIIAYYLDIQKDTVQTVRDILLKAVDNEAKTGRRTIQRFDKHFSALGKIKIKNLTEKHIRSALDTLLAEKLTKKEFNSTITALNNISDYATYEHLDIVNIRDIIALWRKIKLRGKHLFKQTQKQTKDLAFNRSEASIIVNYAINNPCYKSLAVALLIVTGLRAGELLALELNDIFLKERYLWIKQTEETKTFKILDYVKENKCREVYLSKEAVQILDACLKYRKTDKSDSPFLILNPSAKDGKMHLRALDDYLRTFIHQSLLGYDDTREARSVHDLRRTYATLEYINGTDIYSIKSQLGHSSISQTEAYIKDLIEATVRQKKPRTLLDSGFLMKM